MTRAEAAKHHIEDPAAIEHTDVQPKGVLIFLGGLFAALALTLVVVFWLFNFFGVRRAPYQPFPVIKADQIPPEPRLLVAPGREMRDVRAQEDSILDTYGWVNHGAGVVRIPIDRAMDILAQRGLPARTGQGPVPTSPSTGPQSGGPQTGAPLPRGVPAQPPAAPASGGSQPGAGESKPGGPASRMPQGGGSRSGGPQK